MAKHHAQWSRMIANTQRDLSINKIQKAPALQFRIVPCPECDAEIGQPCLASTGAIRTKGHMSRRRLAVRKLLDEKEESE